MEKNDIYFGDNGLTSTSANHVANLAKEYVQGLEGEVQNVCFVKSEVALIGASEQNVLSEGTYDDELKEIPEKLRTIADAKSLIAWLREAIKAKKQMLENLNDCFDIEDWAKAENITLPSKPEKRVPLDEEDILAQMSVKQRNAILSLRSKAAVIGKYIHPDGKFSKERKSFYDRKKNRHDVKGEGRDTLLYTYTPSVEEKTLEETFFALQNEHRGIQAQLNAIEHEISEKVREDATKALLEYNQAWADYRIQMNECETAFKAYKLNRSASIGALKIIIPNDLRAIYEIVNKLGK